MGRSFEDLVAEAAAAPITGWDFSWLDGRATEQRPSWGYSRLLAERVAGAAAVLDVQTGGGEVLAGAGPLPPRTAATESWPPNLAVAARRLGPLGVQVVGAADEADLPFADASFDLVSSRHPVVTRWDEIARVLRPGGILLTQQVGAGTMAELSTFVDGPRPARYDRDPGRAQAAATDAGLEVTRFEAESLPTVFSDIGAVVYYLRLVVWVVPGFSVERHRDRLLALHERIERDGAFVAHAKRFLLEARKPA